MLRTKMDWEHCGNVMEIDEIIEKTKLICKANGVKKLSLFGSFAKGNAAFTSDIDFVIYGCKDIEKLEKDLEQIETLRKIDIFEYENIRDKFLLEEIENYEKQIYETF